MLPNLNILTRAFRIKVGKFDGTAFTVDFGTKQYLITAQHVVGSTQLKTVQIESNSGWQDLQVEVVGHSLPDIDVSVLFPSRRLHNHRDPIKLPSSWEVSVGQDVYFSGFALGLSTPSNMPDFPYPVPLVKKGMVSGFDQYRWYLDGISNLGMSGGPVFMMDDNTPNVIGVVTSRRIESAIVHPTSDSNQPHVSMNAGIVTATRIEWALDLMAPNPIRSSAPGLGPST